MFIIDHLLLDARAILVADWPAGSLNPEAALMIAASSLADIDVNWEGKDCLFYSTLEP